MSYIGNAPTSVAFLTDQFSGTGSQTVFTMSVAPASTGSILVCVTGVTQDPSTYSISGTTLTFSQAPPSGTGNISVRYLGIPASNIATTAYRTVTDFTATLAQTIFTVPSYTVGYIDVYRNGVRLGVADYTATNGTTVVLTIGASTGDLVTTESFYVSSVLNAIPAVAGAVTSSYILDGAVGTAEIASGVTLTAPNISTITNGVATLSLPVTTDTLVGKATTDTLTNKTLGSGTVMPTGSVLQVVNYQTGALITGTTLIPADDTIPQNTEGFEVMTLAITPKFATSMLIIQSVAHVSITVAGSYRLQSALFQDTTVNALAASSMWADSGNLCQSEQIINHKMTSGTTSATTFKIRVGSQLAATLSFNGSGGVRLFGGVMASSITIWEIAA